MKVLVAFLFLGIFVLHKTGEYGLGFGFFVKGGVENWVKVSDDFGCEDGKEGDKEVDKDVNLMEWVLGCGFEVWGIVVEVEKKMLYFIGHCDYFPSPFLKVLKKPPILVL